MAAVADRGPAAAAGAAEGDVLVSVDGRVLAGEADRASLESLASSDNALLLTVVRGSRTKLMAVFPEPLDSRASGVPLTDDGADDTAPDDLPNR